MGAVRGGNRGARAADRGRPERSEAAGRRREARGAGRAAGGCRARQRVDKAAALGAGPKERWSTWGGCDLSGLPVGGPEKGGGARRCALSPDVGRADRGIQQAAAAPSRHPPRRHLVRGSSCACGGAPASSPPAFHCTPAHAALIFLVIFSRRKPNSFCRTCGGAYDGRGAREFALPCLQGLWAEPQTIQPRSDVQMQLCVVLSKNAHRVRKRRVHRALEDSRPARVHKIYASHTVQAKFERFSDLRSAFAQRPIRVTGEFGFSNITSPMIGTQMQLLPHDVRHSIQNNAVQKNRAGAAHRSQVTHFRARTSFHRIQTERLDGDGASLCSCGI